MANWMITLSLLFALATFAECKVPTKQVLSRRKRYLTFPEGSVVSFAFCVTSATYVFPPKIFTQNLAWGVEYELPPNDTFPFKEFLLPKFVKKRRNRRDLYEKIESLITTLGYNGKECILRSLCEASQKFKSKEGSLFHLIYKIIFGTLVIRIHYLFCLLERTKGNSYDVRRTSCVLREDMERKYPEEGLLPYEPEEHQLYHSATHTGLADEQCDKFFNCPFSLIDVALGYYSQNLT